MVECCGTIVGKNYAHVQTLTSFRWRCFAFCQWNFNFESFAFEISSFNLTQSLQTANLWKVRTYSQQP
jgi:hypothetical protein